MAIVIHKLNITAEAALDINEGVGLPELDRRKLKAEVEEYIFRMSASGRLPWWGYFRCDYICEDSGAHLKLFIYKGWRVGFMQCWDLAGVCLAKDWSEEAEEDGLVRAWLQTKITDLDDTGHDWAVSARVWQVLNDTNKTLFENVLEEVKNEFDCKRDKEAAEKLAFLQSVYFEFKRKRVKKKARRDRKRDKRT